MSSFLRFKYLSQPSLNNSLHIHYWFICCFYCNPSCYFSCSRSLHFFSCSFNPRCFYCIISCFLCYLSSSRSLCYFSCSCNLRCFYCILSCFLCSKYNRSVKSCLKRAASPASGPSSAPGVIGLAGYWIVQLLRITSKIGSLHKLIWGRQSSI